MKPFCPFLTFFKCILSTVASRGALSMATVDGWVRQGYFTSLAGVDRRTRGFGSRRAAYGLCSSRVRLCFVFVYEKQIPFTHVS